MFDLKLFSKYKSYLMGIAIIMIMIFHSNLPVVNTTFIKSHLYIGVDIFLFLSGIEIAHSLSKTSSLKDYYKRRFFKILSIALPVIIFFSFFMLIFDDSFGTLEFYLQCTFLNFFSGQGKFPLMLWYIPTILLYYLVSPFIYKFYNNSKSKIKAITILIIICFMFAVVCIPCMDIFFFNYISNRFFIYVLGLIFGIRILNKEKMSSWELTFWMLFSIVCLATLIVAIPVPSKVSLLVNNLSFIPIVVVFCMVCCYGLEYFSNKKIRFKFLDVLGKYTLAIYVSHEMLQFIIRGAFYKLKLFNISFMFNPYWFALVVSVFTIIVAILWTKLVNYLLEKN